MGDYTTSISFVATCLLYFKQMFAKTHKWKKVQKMMNATLSTHIVYKEIINSTFFRT